MPYLHTRVQNTYIVAVEYTMDEFPVGFITLDAISWGEDASVISDATVGEVLKHRFLLERIPPTSTKTRTLRHEIKSTLVVRRHLSNGV